MKRKIAFTCLLVLVLSQMAVAFAQDNSNAVTGASVTLPINTLPVNGAGFSSNIAPGAIIPLGNEFFYRVDRYIAINPMYNTSRLSRFKPVYNMSSPDKPMLNLEGRPFICDII